MARDILWRINDRTRAELAKILDVEADLLLPDAPAGKNLEWYNAADARDEARFIASSVAEDIGEKVAE